MSRRPACHRTVGDSHEFGSVIGPPGPRSAAHTQPPAALFAGFAIGGAAIRPVVSSKRACISGRQRGGAVLLQPPPLRRRETRPQKPQRGGGVFRHGISSATKPTVSKPPLATSPCNAEASATCPPPQRGSGCRLGACSTEVNEGLALSGDLVPNRAHAIGPPHCSRKTRPSAGA